MQHTDKATAAFEAWWIRQPFREQFEDVKDQMRNVWVASRRELVVQLPKPFSAAACRASLALRDKNEMLRECRAAIEAACVTVRG